MRTPIDLLIHPEYFTFGIAELQTPVMTSNWKECLWHIVHATGATPCWKLEEEPQYIDWSQWLKSKYLPKKAQFREVDLMKNANSWILTVDRVPVSSANDKLNDQAILTQLLKGMLSANGLDYAFQALSFEEYFDSQS